MGKLNIPDTRKLLGFNVAPKQSYGTSQPFENWILDWESAGRDWWWQQVLRAAGNGLGLNCHRMIGAQMGVIAGLYSQATYDSIQVEIAEKLLAIGVHHNPTGFGKSAYNNLAPGASMATVAASLATTWRKLQVYPNVIGFDVINEANGASNPSDANLIALIGLLRANGVNGPFTSSTSESNVASAATAPWVYAMAANFDYIDLHMYTYPCTMQYLDGLRAAYPNHDLIMGEFGRAKSVGITRVRPDLRQAMDLANSGDPRIRGGLIWAVTDQDSATSNQWGIYAADGTVDSLDMLLLMKQYTGGSVARMNSRKA